MDNLYQYLSVNSLRRFSQQPYPLYYTKTNYWKFFGLIFFLSYFFNFFFEPFEVNRSEHKMSYFWICFLHAFLPTLIATAYFLIINYTTKSYYNWTVGKEFLHISSVLFLIGISNFFIRDVIYNNPDNWSLRYLFEEVRNTFLVGILIMSVLIPVNYSLLLHKNAKSAQKVNGNRSKPVANGHTQLIQTQVKAEEFELLPDDLIAVRSDGNYSEFFIKSKNGVVKLLKRVSLKELELQLIDYPHLMKTHRGWLVNLNWVSQTTGNAGGYQLTLSDFPEKVPVSRSLISSFNEKMATLNH